jgi:hypothetical protein
MALPGRGNPAPEEQEGWLYDVWAEIDRWIGSELTRTG